MSFVGADAAHETLGDGFGFGHGFAVDADGVVWFYHKSQRPR